MLRTIRQSFRRKKATTAKVPESSRPHQWQKDEESVKDAKCSFRVKYLGSVEVQESRGMHICEQAVKQLKAHKKKKIKAMLYVSPDALRVVEDSTKALLLDQTIEKVSFCAPDRNYDRAFSYICRDGTTRRWLCHSFFAIKESGERLSHAVGCAFAACLEKKQKREKESVSVEFGNNGVSFTREGSFRVKTMTEQLQEEQNKINNPVLMGGSDGDCTQQVKVDVHNPSAVPRPHAPAHLKSRASMRITNKKRTQQTDDELHSPFKRGLSLQLNKLPSNISRLQNHNIMYPVPEVEDEGEQQFTRSFTRTNNNHQDDPFSKAPMQKLTSAQPAITNNTIQSSNQQGIDMNQAVAPVQALQPLNLMDMTSSPVRDTNPWARSDADKWLSDLERQISLQPTFTQQQQQPTNNNTSWPRPHQFQVSM